MGDHVDCFRTRSVPGGQSIGPARPPLRVPGTRGRRAGNCRRAAAAHSHYGSDHHEHRGDGQVAGHLAAGLLNKGALDHLDNLCIRLRTGHQLNRGEGAHISSHSMPGDAMRVRAAAVKRGWSLAERQLEEQEEPVEHQQRRQTTQPNPE